MILTAMDLDDLVRAGCGNPDCHNPDCQVHAMWLHVRCHRSAGTRAALDGKVLQLSCAKYGRTAARIALKDVPEMIAPPCHKVKPIWACYKKNLGALELSCKTCERVFATLPVALMLEDCVGG
jgi:hypothetical protein